MMLFAGQDCPEKVAADIVADAFAVRDGIFELRAKVGSDISRVLYFFFVGRKIILTNGFIKKTQKTPRGEIEKANTYRKEYLSRKENRL